MELSIPSFSGSGCQDAKTDDPKKKINKKILINFIFFSLDLIILKQLFIIITYFLINKKLLIVENRRKKLSAALKKDNHYNLDTFLLAPEPML